MLRNIAKWLTRPAIRTVSVTPKVLIHPISAGPSPAQPTPQPLAAQPPCVAQSPPLRGKSEPDQQPQPQKQKQQLPPPLTQQEIKGLDVEKQLQLLHAMVKKGYNSYGDADWKEMCQFATSTLKEEQLKSKPLSSFNAQTLPADLATIRGILSTMANDWHGRYDGKTLAGIVEAIMKCPASVYNPDICYILRHLAVLAPKDIPLKLISRFQSVILSKICEMDSLVFLPSCHNSI